jgi:hypothetical protein
MADSAPAAIVWPRLTAPNRHPPSRAVPLALSKTNGFAVGALGVRRPASTSHDKPTTPSTESTI